MKITLSLPQRKSDQVTVGKINLLCSVYYVYFYSVYYILIVKHLCEEKLYYFKAFMKMNINLG